jgi:hypothetical protein
MKNQQIAIPNLHHALSILTNMINTFRIIAEHESAVAQEQSLCQAVHHEFQRELRNLSREVDNYIETSHKFLRMADDLKSMVRPDSPTHILR